MSIRYFVNRNGLRVHFVGRNDPFHSGLRGTNWWNCGVEDVMNLKWALGLGSHFLLSFLEKSFTATSRHNQSEALVTGKCFSKGDPLEFPAVSVIEGSDPQKELEAVEIFSICFKNGNERG
ncbi:hypothetical protein KY284_030278 [Solanum tuberosum]|nr:hypothetical protein KY284_030278 [Solanum tuberosum]